MDVSLFLFQSAASLHRSCKFFQYFHLQHEKLLYIYIHIYIYIIPRDRSTQHFPTVSSQPIQASVTLLPYSRGVFGTSFCAPAIKFDSNMTPISRSSPAAICVAYNITFVISFIHDRNTLISLLSPNMDTVSRKRHFQRRQQEVSYHI